MKTNVYVSEKGRLTRAVYAGVILLLLSIVVTRRDEMTDKPLALVLLLVPVGFLLWLWLDTWYRIEEGFLVYKSGPFRGRIAIDSIREITKNKTLFVGFKPALGQKGLIIRYNGWEEIYISPHHKEAFLAELLRRNGAIVIRE
jgi:hypothetical protein